MTTCEPCALRDTGETGRADALESIRAQRLILAMLNGAPDAVEAISAELRGCQDCTGRLAAHYLGTTMASLVHITGSVNAAIKAIE
jgi:hypothetical protein